MTTTTTTRKARPVPAKKTTKTTKATAARATKPAPAPTQRQASVVTTGRATPRRILSVADDLWWPFSELANGRGLNASELVRQMMVIAVHEARQSGELAPPVRGNGKVA